MTSKIGYSNLEALLITFITLGVSLTFGYHMAQVLLAYVSASFGLFVLYALDMDDQNRYLWPYTESMRWFGVLVLTIIYVKRM